MASGYDALLREKIIKKLEELEKKNHMEQYQVPQSFSDLTLAAKQQEKIEQQQIALESKSKEIVQLGDNHRDAAKG